MKSIFFYNDYRKFLEQYYIERKEQTGFSYRMFSELLGLNSPNYMKLVISKKRNLTVPLIHTICSKLRFSFTEREYFEALVLRDQSSTEEEKKFYQKRLRGMKVKSTMTIRPKNQMLSSKWYFPLVVTAMDGLSQDSALQQVSGQTGLPKNEVEQTIQFLLQQNILVVNDGCYRLTGHYVVYDDPSSRRALQKRFQGEQLKLSQWVLQNEYEKKAKFLAHTFTISKKSFSYYYEKISDFLAEMTEESNQETPEETVQLNIQFFPVTDIAKRMAKRPFGVPQGG